MFVQVIQGPVSDPEGMRAALDRWAADLAPGAQGWLGTAAGVTDDGVAIAVTQFESEEAARRNNDRPEQDRWWAETARLFSGEVTFRDSASAVVDMVGDADEAGFVQVIEGQGTDPDRSRQLMAQETGEWAEYRPDILGTVGAQHDDGAFTMAVFFTSEEDAREAERQELPPRLKAQMDEMNALSVGAPQYFDLRQPWLYSPR
ncbi:hypothetical protein [Phytohabitans kaempferiae]|uniref:ABM domain-containing protein n=1 Tax=Phytohabitans kaempferiae TaxID=1620943 RepID=A0ABV6MAI1_9ACTN